MTADPVDPERLTLISAILADGFRKDESTGEIIGRLFQELGDGSQEGDRRSVKSWRNSSNSTRSK